MNTNSALLYKARIDEISQSEKKLSVITEKSGMDADEFLRFFHCKLAANTKQKKMLLSDIEQYGDCLLETKDCELETKCDEVLLAIRNNCDGSVFVAKSLLSILIVHTYKKYG